MRYSRVPSSSSLDSSGSHVEAGSASSSPRSIYPVTDGEEVMMLKPQGRTANLANAFRQKSLRFLIFLKPSFLDFSQLKHNRPPPQTQYLDGIRGIASLIVVNLHWARDVFPSVNVGWGFNDNYNILLLPFVRLIYSGSAMVAVFFMISGYVMAYLPVRQMHRRDYAELHAGLTSSTFRRSIRLFAPAVAASFLTFIVASLPGKLIRIPKTTHGKQPFHHGVFAYLDYLDWESNVWEWEMATEGFYNSQFWTISVQFRGSMYAYILLAGLARTRTSVRLLVELVAMVHPLLHQRWDMGLFAAGIILAEVDVLVRKHNRARESHENEEEEKSEKQSQSPSPHNTRTRRSSALLRAGRATALYVTLLLGLYLCGFPRDFNAETAGYMWAAEHWPYTPYRRRFWLAVGSVLFVSAAAFLGPVQRVFTTRVALYFGRISFALFLTHFLCIRTFGMFLRRICKQAIGIIMAGPDEGDDGQQERLFIASYALATVLFYPLVIWVADVFWRGIEMPSVKLASWVERKSMASPRRRTGCD